MIKEIQEAVTIPVMAKARIGHFAEAQVLQALEVDYIDESEVLTPADEANHIDKLAFEVPFVCGATNLGEALRRIGEGAAMIRSKGEAGTGNIVEAVRHMREIVGGIKRLAHAAAARSSPAAAKELQRAARGRPGGRRARLAAGAAVLRRRHRDAGRRGADDAARRRGQLRRLGDLQVARTRSGGPGRSSRRPRTSTTPSGSPRPRSELGEPMRGDDIAELAAEGELLQQRGWLSAVRGSADRLRIGVLAIQGDFEAHARDAARARRRGGRGAHRPRTSTASTALVIPGGESTTIAKGIERDGLEPAIRAHAEAGRPILGTCAGMIVCDRDHLGLVDATAPAQRLRPPARRASRRTSRSRGSATEPLRAVFIRAPWVEDARRRGRGARRGRRPPGRGPRGQTCSPAPSTPS